MRILILYSARSGTNSISEYFLLQNPDYEYYNQPWSMYYEEGMTKISYDDCIKKKNVLVKSEINCFKSGPNTSKERLKSDFDKILLISRKNKREQAISAILAKKNKNFLEKTRRKYLIESIEADELEISVHNLNSCDLELDKFKDDDIPFFYYEDMFYGSFKEIFNFLNLDHRDSDFNKILHIDKRYFSGEIKEKKSFSLI